MGSKEQARYKTICSECEREFYAAKSILQEMGMHDRGHASCPGCNTFLNLTFNQEKEIMETKTWDEHIKRVE